MPVVMDRVHVLIPIPFVLIIIRMQRKQCLMMQCGQLTSSTAILPNHVVNSEQ